MFHKEGTKTILLGIIFTASVLLISDNLIALFWLKKAIQIAAFLILVIILQFFSGVFFVFTQLPSWMQQVAAIFPLKWLTQGMRSVFLPDSFASQEVAKDWETGKTVVILLVWLAIGIFFSVRKFKWDRD